MQAYNVQLHNEASVEEFKSTARLRDWWHSAENKRDDVRTRWQKHIQVYVIRSDVKKLCRQLRTPAYTRNVL
jgi:hypothetical protein